MTNKVNRVHMSFEFLSDAKAMYSLMMTSMAACQGISAELSSKGVPHNSRMMSGYRDDARFILGSLLAVSDEIIRLHDQCTDAQCVILGDPEAGAEAHASNESAFIEVLRHIEEEDRMCQEAGLISEEAELAILVKLIGNRLTD